MEHRGLIFDWIKRRRRRKILAQPLMGDWRETLGMAIPWYQDWDEGIRKKLLDDTRIFIAEKDWEGCKGLTVTEEMKYVIAAQAAMMLVGIDGYCFDAVRTILVYPASFRRETRNGLIVSNDSRIGEAWHRGPIVLSWADVARSYPGRNVVVHELAHHLDGLDGDISGNPILANAAEQEHWETVASEGFERLKKELAEGQPVFLDSYAATNRAEYFAVACEAFFEVPDELKLHHPQLYGCLAGLFNADPAGWSSS